MFPPGSTVEDLPPHLQKLFWELGNMHFEKDENGDWRFADDRGELGYFQYLIRQALREGDNEKLTQHFQDANKYIDTTLLTWSDNELTEVRESATSVVIQKQNAIPNGSASNKRIELMVETNKGVVDVNHALQQKSLEIKQDFVERERQHLNTFVNTQVTEHQNIAHQAITTNMSQVAIRMQPPVTSGVVGGGGGVMPLHIITPNLSNIINTIPLTLSSDALPVPPPPDTGNLIVMAGTTPEEIDTILATQYTHYLDTNYDVALTTDGASQWNATETYNVFLATENTAQALYYQAIQSGLLDLGMSRFALDTLSPEQVFRNAIGHVDIRKTGSGDLTHTWQADTDDTLITFSSVPEGELFQWAITREFGRILDNRSFNYGTSELQQNGIVHNNQFVSGFHQPWYREGESIYKSEWVRGNEGLLDMTYLGGPLDRYSGENASDEWADMFAHWVNFTNFRMTQPYDSEDVNNLFIAHYLGVNNFDSELSQATPEELYTLLQRLDSNALNDLIRQSNYNENMGLDSLNGSLIASIQNTEAYKSMMENMPTYFNRMASMDNWVSGSLFTANLWREPSFRQQLINEIGAVENSGILDTPIYNYNNQVYSIYELDQTGRHYEYYIHHDFKNTIQTYTDNISELEDLSAPLLRETYQSQRQLLLRILPSLINDTHNFIQLFQHERQFTEPNSTVNLFTPYTLHALTNIELSIVAQELRDRIGYPIYHQIVDWYGHTEYRPDANTRDVIGVPVANSDALVTEDRPWLLDAVLFAGALMIEPLDWTISGFETIGHIFNNEWDYALFTAALAILPVVSVSAYRRVVNEIDDFFVTPNRLVTPEGVVINSSQWDDDIFHFSDIIGDGLRIRPPQRLNVGNSGLPSDIIVPPIALGDGHCKDFIRQMAPILNERGFEFRIYRAHPTDTPLFIDGLDIADVDTSHYFIEYNGFVFDNFNWSNPRVLDDYLGQLGSQTQVTLFEPTSKEDLEKFISSIQK